VHLLRENGGLHFAAAGVDGGGISQDNGNYRREENNDD
jgi:hypothetical protein